MYKEAFLDEDDFTISLHDDLVKLIVNVIFSDELYKLLILLYRVDNFEFDKDLRLKYQSMKGVKTTDFAIDPYLSLADPLVVMKEASKRYGLSTIETTSEQYTNPTVQKVDFEDLVNIEFKEYFKKNSSNIAELPEKVRKEILQKAKIRPYQKSVLKFREIMTSSKSPLEKLISLQDLKL